MSNYSLFAVKKYADSVDKVITRKGLIPKWHHHLLALRPDKKEAVFDVKGQDTGMY